MTSMSDSTRALGADDIERFTKQFGANPAYRLAQNAVTSTSLDDVALDRTIVNTMATSMSTVLDDWEATNQKQSGRCWLFAGLNLLRVGAAKKMGVKDFEFSQNYLLYWDKLEKANFWLEAIIETADRDVDDRTVAHLLANPAEDGGQWNMFVALVRKHGLVPKSAMPETHSSSKTGMLNRSIGQLMRRTARDLRQQAANGASGEQLGDAFWSQKFAQPDGGELHLGALRKKPLVVNFWATWCAPCVEEMPMIDAFYREHGAKGVQVVGLAIDQPSSVRKFLERTPVTYPIGLAGMQGTQLLRDTGNTAGGLPFTLLIGADGVVATRKMGKLERADLETWRQAQLHG